MALLGIDLGGTKLAIASFTNEGKMISSDKVVLRNRKGKEVGSLITEKITEYIRLIESGGDVVSSIGISVPGIYYSKTGTVWAPNISDWTNYPLLDEIKAASGNTPVTVDSDRACYILGELWQGNAQGCGHAIFLSVGTGIGAGILVDGAILRGAHDIAGAIGWMALNPPFVDDYTGCGCFEYHASGEGLVKVARQYLHEDNAYNGALAREHGDLTTQDVFTAFENNDPLAIWVVQQGIQFWGMAIANLVSLFNPEKIILGGGVFGPALALLPEIRSEARKWAQPVSVHQYSLEGSALGGEAGVYGAGFLALKNVAP